MGNIIFTTKVDFIRNCKCYGFEAIALVDSQYDLVELNLDPNLIQVGSILVPSYDAINAYMDGNQQAFEMEYIKQLMYRDCDEFLSLIAYALFQNKNIVIYVGEEQSIVPYIDTLANYIRQSFGIIIGIDSDMGNVDLNYIDIWTTKFYLYDFITFEDFLSQYSIDKPIIPDVLGKLITDDPPLDYMKPQVLSSIDSCNQWYMYKVKCRHNMVKSLYNKN